MHLNDAKNKMYSIPKKYLNTLVQIFVFEYFILINVSITVLYSHTDCKIPIEMKM